MEESDVSKSNMANTRSRHVAGGASSICTCMRPATPAPSPGAHHFQSAADHAAQQVGVLEPRQLLWELHKVGERVVLQDLSGRNQTRPSA